MIAETLADQTLTAFGAVRGAVVLRSEDEDTLETVAWRGHDATVIERWRRFPLDDTSPIGQAVLRNEPVVMVDADDGLTRFSGLTRDEIPAAAASIPLDVGGRADRRLTLSFEHPREFTADDIGFMLGAARQGAQALERARSDEVRRLAEERPRSWRGRAVSSPSRWTIRRPSPPWSTSWSRGSRTGPRSSSLEPNGSINTLAVAHVDPEKIAMAKEFRRHRPPDLSAPTGLGHVIATGEPEMVPEITEEMIAANRRPRSGTADPRAAAGSAMIVPLSARGRTLGAMTYVWAESGRTYSSADLALAQTLAARVALVIDNARLYRDRDHIARTLQHSLLPPDPPTIEGLDLAASYRPRGKGSKPGGLLRRVRHRRGQTGRWPSATWSGRVRTRRP